MAPTSFTAKRFTLLMCVALCISVRPLSSQETTGTIDGRITDSLGVPIPGALVTATSPSLQGQRSLVTNTEGLFRIQALPIGEYAVRISHVAFRPARVENVRVRLGATTGVGTVRLQPETLPMPEVTVVHTPPLVDPVSTTAGGSLVPEEFGSLPVQRTYDKIIALLPQANESYLGDGVNVAGATGMENKYFIDGVDVSDPYRGLTGSNLPYNIIREIQVKSGAYEAEYRSTLGGVVNVVTYSGGNEFSGRAYGYFTNNDLSGTPRGGTLEPSSGKFAQYDLGFGLGGPIMRDRLWFFLAYNPVFQSEDVDVPGLGYFPDKTVSHVVAGNMTWRVSEGNSLMLSLSGDPTERDAVGQSFGEFGTPTKFLNPDPYLGRATLGGLGVRLTGTHILSDMTLLEFSLSWMRRNDRYMPATSVGESQPLYIDMATGTWSGGYPMRVDNTSTVAGGSVRGTLQLRNHTLKGGVAYTDTELDAAFTVALIQRFSPFAYTAIKYASQGTLHNRVPSAFVQDSWDIAPWFTLNAGVRWDGQFIFGSNGELAQRILGQWQPRAGLVFRPGTEGTDKIAASYGRFYQDLLMYASTLYHVAGATQQVIAYNHDPRTDPTGGRPVVNLVSTIQPEIDGMRGQSYDEFTLGYEREITGGFVAGVRGVYRSLVDAIEDAEYPVGSKELVLANPGRAPLSSYPMPERKYAGLEFTLQRAVDANPWFLVSYVLSRNSGNYPGLFNSDFEIRLPNANKSFDYLENLVNGTGRLPNDRAHVVKLSASYRFDFNLSVGIFALWESGTPLSEFGGSTVGGFNYNFLRQRGTNGETPSLWDVNIRLMYDLPASLIPAVRIRLIADAVHIGSPRTPVDYEQIHYFNVDANGNQINPNPTYMQPVKFQPPMSFRVGLEVMF
jgi:hypothetical protein